MPHKKCLTQQKTKKGIEIRERKTINEKDSNNYIQYFCYFYTFIQQNLFFLENIFGKIWQQTRYFNVNVESSGFIVFSFREIPLTQGKTQAFIKKNDYFNPFK